MQRERVAETDDCRMYASTVYGKKEALQFPWLLPREREGEGEKERERERERRGEVTNKQTHTQTDKLIY